MQASAIFESYRHFEGFDPPPVTEWPPLPEAVASHNSSQVHCSSSCKKVICSSEATPSTDFLRYCEVILL